MPREVNATLRQKGSYGQTLEYQILDGKELRVATTYKNRQSVYLVSLLALQESGKAHFHFAWRWLIAAAIPAGLLGIFVLLQAVAGLEAGIYAFPLTGGLSLLILAFLILFFTNTCRLREYLSRHAGVRLFQIRTGNPSHRECKAFIEVLEAYIQKCRDFWQLTMEQQLAGELRTLRRLAQEKVISRDDYEQAKTQLFSLSNGKSSLSDSRG
jgi:hypothetical protein